MMLLLTGLLNCYLSKKKKESPPEGFVEPYRDCVCITETEETEQTSSFFNNICNNSIFNISSDCSQAILAPDYSTQNNYNLQSQAEQRNVQFQKSLKVDYTEMKAFDMEPAEVSQIQHQ
ncbi:hypothetical protein Baya_2123 [Bagarius yarrelli]|uniref:Uncharacterized protein n=1 Tax=Bagarius yarrelli TaxID=175774 RepID=A0A556TN20_BAGYA|nr:hypothetical protein Baya_2123 [Bagarius yarrelli]